MSLTKNIRDAITVAHGGLDEFVKAELDKADAIWEEQLGRFRGLLKDAMEAVFSAAHSPAVEADLRALGEQFVKDVLAVLTKTAVPPA